MDDLLIKYVMGEATADEAARVERWLEADAANRRLYEEYKTLWTVSRQTADRESAVSVDTGEAWRRLRSAKVLRSGGRIVGDKSLRLSRSGWMRVAAVVAGTLLLGAGGYLLFRAHRQAATPGLPLVAIPDRPLIPTAQPGGARTTEVPRTMKFSVARPRTDTLPDGTVVTLNRGSELAIVGGSVEKGLTVRLRGEGFFSVKHDPARSFVVQIGAIVVKVLGTSFELNGAGKDSIELIVETGAVRVGNQMTVHAGERMIVTANGHWRISPNRDKLYGYYLGRPLVCNSLPLRRLVEVLNRSDDIPIVLGRKELEDLPLTTVFRGKSPARILEVVALTFNLSIVRQGSEIILR